MAFVTVVVTAADSDPIRKSGLFLDILCQNCTMSELFAS